MSNIQTKSSVLALKAESTEGTIVAPTAGTDAVALQTDISIAPAFDSLTSDEMRSSIGTAKAIQGLEKPTMSFSHYLRASGTAGTEPNYKLLPYAFFGAKSVASTEYDTVASSTVTTLNVDTGEGAYFERGQGVLIKDATNGYRIRTVHSVSSDALTLGFDVPTAPGTGVNLGKCVLYKPANTGHPTFSAWLYRGNGGDIEAMAGCRVTSMAIDVTAGSFLNVNYSIEGTASYFDPIEITASSKYLDFTDDAGTFAAVIPVKMYKDPHELAAAIQTAIDDVTTTTPTVTYSNTTGKFTIKTTGTLLTLKWNTGSNTANSIAAKIGFSTAADSSGTVATTGYTSPTALSFAFGYTPSYDSVDPNVGKNMEVMIGDHTDYTCFEASSIKITATGNRAPLNSLCAESGVSGSIISAREINATVTARLSKYDVDAWKRFRAGSDTRMQISFGQKSGGSWVAGYCGYIYMPTCTVTSIAINDADGLAIAEIGLKAYVDTNGYGEFYLGFL